MRLSGYLIAGLVVTFAGVWALAEVNLHEFAPGTVIKSSEVNENFTAIRDALTNKQVRVTGECAAGSSIRAIGADGTVLCHVDQVGEGGDFGVHSLNGLSGAIVLQAGDNIAIDTLEEGELVISATTSPNGLGAVVSDGTLSGEGTSAAPLGIAEGAVTASKLDDFGASAGQVLKFDGTTWLAAEDDDTTYAAGSGIILSGAQFSLDTEMLDSRYVMPDGNGAFAVSGTYSFTDPGPAPAVGPGARLMWHPGKAAFRAGQVTGAQWDDADLADFSAAWGRNTMARGVASAALGQFTVAGGTGSNAMGNRAEALGRFSTAIGDGVVARGEAMVVVGAFNASRGTLDSKSLTDPLFVVGNGLDPLLSGDALRLDWNGNLRIAGALTENSDRTRKHDVTSAEPLDILARLRHVPISTWRYDDDPVSRRIGPMAQDFHETFEVGVDGRGISSLDTSGVALAAIQALDRLVTAQEAQIAELETRIAELERMVAVLAEAVELSADHPEAGENEVGR